MLFVYTCQLLQGNYKRTSLYQIFNRSNLKSGLHFLSSSHIHVFLANCYLDTVLTNNVIATYKVTSHADCLFHCSENERCKSYNYQHKLMNSTEGKLGLCELNSMRMNSCPLRKVRKEGHDYFEEVNVPEKDKVYVNTIVYRQYPSWVNSLEQDDNISIAHVRLASLHNL